MKIIYAKLARVSRHIFLVLLAVRNQLWFVQCSQVQVHTTQELDKWSNNCMLGPGYARLTLLPVLSSFQMVSLTTSTTINSFVSHISLHLSSFQPSYLFPVCLSWTICHCFM